MRNLQFIALLVVCLTQPAGAQFAASSDPCASPAHSDDCLIREGDEFLPCASRLPLCFGQSDEPSVQQDDFYDFMWRSFIALNWPNVPIEESRDGERIVSGHRGEPDESRSLEALSNGSLAVWEAYKESYEVFPAPQNWDSWDQWNVPRPLPPGATARRDDPGECGGYESSSRRLLRYPDLTGYATDFNQPYFFPFSTGPLIDQNGHYVYYEVAVNRSFFEYVRYFGYYDADVQKQAVANWIQGHRDASAFHRPPFGNPEEFEGYLRDLPPWARQGMIDVKAAWKVLDCKAGDRPERFLHRWMVIDDEGTTRLMGLVALHILRYTPNNYAPPVAATVCVPTAGGSCAPPPTPSPGSFVASTFEHVDNVCRPRLPGDSDSDTQPEECAAGVSPSFNDGSLPNREQATLGFEGAIPPQAKLPKPRRPVDIYRVTPLPESVRAINERYRHLLRGSVLEYYQLIGTQNHHQGGIVLPPHPEATPLATNGHEGPTTGVYTNTSNLINVALESYSQKNFSCILCHVRARPQGVPDAAFEVDHFKTLTFLLQSAQSQQRPPR